MNEIDLISGIKNNSISAINYFVQAHQQFVFVLCVKMTNDREISEEITQDVMIKCIDKINAFEGKSKLKTWVYKIAHNEVLNHLRKNKINTTELNEETTGRSYDKSILNEMNDLDLKYTIDKYFNKLPTDQKELLTLFYLDELSLKEIEDITNLSASNVRVKLHRGRDQFRKLLSEKDVNLLNQLRYE